jgi:hypothetical protein
MGIHLLALVLVGGIAANVADGKAPLGKVPPPATAEDLRLEKAARDCRIQIYESFHNDRAEYDRRQAEAASVEKAWSDAGASDEEQYKLIDWLESATTRSRTDAIGELPPMPKFTVVVQTKVPPQKLVEAAQAASVRETAAKVDDLLHVKPADSTAAAPNTPATEGTAPQFKPSVISSLPKAFEAEITGTLHGLAGKSAPKSP